MSFHNFEECRGEMDVHHIMFLHCFASNTCEYPVVYFIVVRKHFKPERPTVYIIYIYIYTLTSLIYIYISTILNCLFIFIYIYIDITGTMDIYAYMCHILPFIAARYCVAPIVHGDIELAPGPDFFHDLLRDGAENSVPWVAFPILYVYLYIYIYIFIYIYCVYI